MNGANRPKSSKNFYQLFVKTFAGFSYKIIFNSGFAKNCNKTSEKKYLK